MPSFKKNSKRRWMCSGITVTRMRRWLMFQKWDVQLEWVLFVVSATYQWPFLMFQTSELYIEKNKQDIFFFAGKIDGISNGWRSLLHDDSSSWYELLFELFVFETSVMSAKIIQPVGVPVGRLPCDTLECRSPSNPADPPPSPTLCY